MRENRTCGSEGGEAQSLPYPYPASPLPSRRVQGGAPRPFGCKAVIRSDPGSGAFWGDAHAGVSSRVQLGAPRPPPYLPAEFKAALPGHSGARR